MPTREEIYTESEKLKEVGDFAGAIAKLEECVAMDPNYALAHSAMAVVLGKLQRHDEAVTHAQTVCQLEPNDPFSFTMLSVTCQRAGKIQEAEDAMARARMLQGGH